LDNFDKTAPLSVLLRDVFHMQKHKSADLEGFTGVGHSIEDCLYKAKWGMIEHINLLKERGLPIPPKNPNPKIIIQNEQELVTV
jgi:predicted RNase H-like HicB family nuclease